MVGKATGLVSFLLLAAMAGGQSLGELAKKEKKRREKNRVQNLAVRVVAEDDISVVEEESTARTADPSGEGSATTPLGEDDETSSDSSASNRAREEAEWRGRMSEARARLKSARERYEFLSGLHLTAGEYYVDQNGNPVITSLNQLRRMTGEAKDGLDKATRAMAELREEARRAGVPPGWLR